MVRITRKTGDKYEELVQRLHLARVNREQADVEVKKLERQMVDLMEADSRKTVTAGEVQVTYVRPTRVKVDEAGLRKALGAKTFDKYTVSKLDTKKLEKGLENEELSAEQVSPFISEEVGSPYLRVSERKSREA